MKKFNITVNGNVYEVLVEEVAANAPVAAPKVVTAPVSAPVAVSVKTEPEPKPAAPIVGGSQGNTKVTSPMPGTILKVNVQVGQTIKKGDIVCILEAMKMENEIPSPRDGVIASVNVQNGASVNTGDVLVTLE